jgi:simple sugar transport system permease protein
MNKNKIFNFKIFIFENIIWFIFILIFLILSIAVENFFSIVTIANLLTRAAPLGLLALAESYCLISGNFDLSIESTLGFTAVIGGWLVAAPPMGFGLMLNSYLVILIVFLIGAAIGLINGLLITKVGINSFLLTLSFLIMFKGFTLFLTQGSTVDELPGGFRVLGAFRLGLFPISIIIMFILYIIFHIFLENRPFGREIYATGGNIKAARASGVNTDSLIIKIFVVSGIIASLTGLVMIGRVNTVSSETGHDMIFSVFAACALGGVSLNGGIGRLTGVLGGVLTISIIEVALIVLHVSPFDTMAIRGLILLVAIILNKKFSSNR